MTEHAFGLFEEKETYHSEELRGKSAYLKEHTGKSKMER